ncbi:MAG: LysR family transcriptional regulator [Pseudomonadota bacterium]
MPVSPLRPKGPPLNALRAFEAAARLGGFSKAAEELCVTPGAITQHIKALEDWVGTPLFERRSQGVRLTRAGARLQPEFTAAFDQMGQAIHALKDAGDTHRVHIAALPSVAQLWLSPRMPGLRAANPQVQFSVTALEQPPNLLRDMFDWAVFFDHPTGAAEEITLNHDAITPVCAPDLADRIRTPDDLIHESLLIDDSWAKDWAIWATKAGWDVAQATRQARFSLYALAVEEARNGAGVLMGHQSLIAADLAAGRLVAPFKLAAPTGLSLILKSTAQARAMADSFVSKL